MRVFSFTPTGSAEFLLPPATEYSTSQRTRSSLVTIAGADGALDLFGSVSPYDMQQIQFPFLYLCAKQSDIDNVRLAFSKRGILRVMQQDTTIRQTSFKATDIAHMHSFRAKGGYADIVITGLLYPYWKSLYTKTKVVSSSPTTVITNGTANVYDSLQIVFTSAGTTTSINLSNTTNGYSLAWTGSLSVGQTLTINVPAMTVVKTGAVDQYPVTTLGATQIGLFKLAAGNNVITYTLSGSGSFTFTWRDTWH